MRVTIALLGWTWDWSIEPTATTEAAEDAGSALNGGTTYATAMTYTADLELPDEAALVDHNNGWGDEGNRVGFR